MATTASHLSFPAELCICSNLSLAVKIIPFSTVKLKIWFRKKTAIEESHIGSYKKVYYAKSDWDQRKKQGRIQLICVIDELIVFSYQLHWLETMGLYNPRNLVFPTRNTSSARQHRHGPRYQCQALPVEDDGWMVLQYLACDLFGTFMKFSDFQKVGLSSCVVSMIFTNSFCCL